MSEPSEGLRRAVSLLVRARPLLDELEDDCGPMGEGWRGDGAEEEKLRNEIDEFLEEMS